MKAWQVEHVRSFPADLGPEPGIGARALQVGARIFCVRDMRAAVRAWDHGKSIGRSHTWIARSEGISSDGNMVLPPTSISYAFAFAWDYIYLTISRDSGLYISAVKETCKAIKRPPTENRGVDPSKEKARLSVLAATNHSRKFMAVCRRGRLFSDFRNACSFDSTQL